MIQIIDGFNLPTETPIDSRIVVADATKRLGISSKYHGLRVWEQDTDTPYYWDGSNWVSELDLVVTGVDGNVTDGKIPKFTSINPTKIEDSKISDDGSTVTIDGILDVTGDLTFGGNLIGDINAVNITTGFLDLARLDVGSGGVDDVLQIDSSGVPKFVSLSGISIGSSSTSNQVKLNNVTNTSYYKFTLREDNFTVLGNSFDLYSYETDLLLSQNSTSMCILAHGGSKENPPYSFYNTISSSKEILGGMYYDNGDSSIDFSIESSGVYESKLKIKADGVQIKKLLGDIEIKTSNYTTPDADSAGSISFNNINSIGVPIGGIIMWSGDPNEVGNGNLWNFAVCDGGSIPTITKDGSTVDVAWSGTTLPDLSGRFAIGVGTVEGSSISPGQLGGESEYVLDSSNLPAHSHEILNQKTGHIDSSDGFSIEEDGSHTHGNITFNANANSTTVGENTLKGVSAGSSAQTSFNFNIAGGDHEHEILDSTTMQTGNDSSDLSTVDTIPPYYVVTYIIRLV